MCVCTRRSAAAGGNAFPENLFRALEGPPEISGRVTAYLLKKANVIAMTSIDKNATKPASSGPSTPGDLQALLGGGKPRRWWQRSTLWLGVAVLVAAGAGIAYWQGHQRASAAPVYVTEEVRRGNLTLNVSANGTLQPTRAVTIGSELSGTVGRVLVDVNDKVRKGQVLVELDTAKLDAQVLRSRASLASAQARL
ncbi:hypothetical protein AcdelDRAFT_4843, partial [Acidovorax delafieldii 2AN]